jgi:hypothetical protein
MCTSASSGLDCDVAIVFVILILVVVSDKQ